MSERAGGISGVGQVSVPVRELARAVAFYRDTLGIPLLFEIPGAAFFMCGGVRLMLSIPESAGQDGSSILYYRVADIQRAHARLMEQGVRFEREPHLIARMPDHELWMAFFRDSEENLAALMAEIR